MELPNQLHGNVVDRIGVVCHGVALIRIVSIRVRAEVRVTLTRRLYEHIKERAILPFFPNLLVERNSLLLGDNLRRQDVHNFLVNKLGHHPRHVQSNRLVGDVVAQVGILDQVLEVGCQFGVVDIDRALAKVGVKVGLSIQLGFYDLAFEARSHQVDHLHKQFLDLGWCDSSRLQFRQQRTRLQRACQKLCGVPLKRPLLLFRRHHPQRVASNGHLAEHQLTIGHGIQHQDGIVLASDQDDVAHFQRDAAVFRWRVDVGFVLAKHFAGLFLGFGLSLTIATPFAASLVDVPIVNVLHRDDVGRLLIKHGVHLGHLFNRLGIQETFGGGLDGLALGLDGLHGWFGVALVLGEDALEGLLGDTHVALAVDVDARLIAFRVLLENVALSFTRGRHGGSADCDTAHIADAYRSTAFLFG